MDGVRTSPKDIARLEGAARRGELIVMPGAGLSAGKPSALPGRPEAFDGSRSMMCRRDAGAQGGQVEQPTSEVPKWLVDEAKARRAVIMAGAGVSVTPPSSLPGWYALNEWIVEALGWRVDRYLERADYTAEIRAAIDARRSAEAFPPDYQAQILVESSGDDYFRGLQCLDVDARNAAHEEIAWLAAHGMVAAIVTTNFDRLIEQSLEARGVPYEVACEPTSYAHCLGRITKRTDAPVHVLKLHGCVSDHRSMVDTLKQRLVGRNTQLLEALAHLLAAHPWFFFGFSADDLETDDGYLGLIPGAKASPGIAYVRWPRSPKLSSGADKLMKAYEGKVGNVIADTASCLAALARALGVPARLEAPANGGSDTPALVKSRLRVWADRLHPAAAVNCLATVAEAAGLAEPAFRLLHRFWKDVIPTDREGPDFERYRFHHGRLGIGGGILSAVDDLSTDVGMESLQNLLRVGESEPRASAWAGVAWVWAGRQDLALPLLSEAQRAFEPGVSVEVRVDAWLAIAEALFGLVQPEGAFGTWEDTARAARKGGDLPREAKVIVMMALFHAEFAYVDYPEFMRQHADPVLARAKRLNDPAIAGFAALAHSRYLTKTLAGAPALEPLQRAQENLRRAGRPPWQVYTSIAAAKALLDHGTLEMAEEAGNLLNDVNKGVDRYQLWLPWLHEAAGQSYLCVGKPAEAHLEFEKAIQYAERMGLTRKVGPLRAYLAHCEPPEQAAH